MIFRFTSRFISRAVPLYHTSTSGSLSNGFLHLFNVNCIKVFCTSSYIGNLTCNIIFTVASTTTNRYSIISIRNAIIAQSY